MYTVHLEDFKPWFVSDSLQSKLENIFRNIIGIELLIRLLFSLSFSLFLELDEKYINLSVDYNIFDWIEEE